MKMSKEKSFWGWGYADYKVDPSRIEAFKTLMTGIANVETFSDNKEPNINALTLRKPRFSISDKLSSICSDDTKDRASHSFGKSFRDIWRASKGLFDNPPDYVAYPRTEDDIHELYNFAAARNISIIPFGGGSSVVGGIEPTLSNNYKGVITVDLKHFNQILEIDKKSRSARIQAGIFGPELERGLKQHGLTLRHFPQSFEFSTLGGWIVTRSGGHFATVYTHIEEFLQSVRMVTPNGILQSRRLPGSGAGPSEERFVAGSEGIFGIVTEAWMRLQEIPKFKSAQTVKFTSWKAAVEACRLIGQSGLNPANTRLIDKTEALINGLGDGQNHIVILGFESADRDMKVYMDQALDICRKCEGSWEIKNKSITRDSKADAWKKSFLEAPYLRDEMIRKGCILETFETSVTWDQFDTFHSEMMKRGRSAIDSICGGGIITCRFTHLYPDGPAPYYTIIAKGQTGNEIEQWDAIKKIVSDTIIELGGTITHHHAVGKDHQPFYEKQRSDVFAESLKAVKDKLDPKWILNPEVLITRNHST